MVGSLEVNLVVSFHGLEPAREVFLYWSNFFKALLVEWLESPKCALRRVESVATEQDAGIIINLVDTHVGLLRETLGPCLEPLATSTFIEGQLLDRGLALEFVLVGVINRVVFEDAQSTAKHIKCLPKNDAAVIHPSVPQMRQVIDGLELALVDIELQRSCLFVTVLLTAGKVDCSADLVVGKGELGAPKLLRILQGVKDLLRRSWAIRSDFPNVAVLGGSQWRSVVPFLLERIAEAVQVPVNDYCFLCADFDIRVPETLEGLHKAVELEDGVRCVVSEDKRILLVHQAIICQCPNPFDPLPRLRQGLFKVFTVIWVLT